MSPAKLSEALSLPGLVQRYVDAITLDSLTMQNTPVIIDLLRQVEEAGKMIELEEILGRHGELGLQSPYSEIIHSCGVALNARKDDGRCITVMRASREAALSGIEANA